MRGYFRKRGDKWSFTVDLGRVDGKRKQKTKGGFKTKKEAQKACAEMISEIENGKYHEPSKLTLNEFMKDFIDNQIKPNYSEGTFYNYEKVLRKWIGPIIGNMPISDITPMHIQKMYSEFMARGYKAGTIKITHSCLKRTLTTAFEWGIISKNPAIVKPPKVEKGSDKTWTLEQCQKFLSKIKHEQYYLVYLLTMFTGLRRGEVLGLPEKNVDFVYNQIKIEQQNIHVTKKEIVKRTKSKSSLRIVDVPGDIMKELHRHTFEQKKKFLSLGIKNEDGLVFVTSKGKALHPNQINKNFTYLIKKHGFPHLTFHGLRHTHATILAEMKENVHAISNRLGHASVTITNEMYIHLTNKMKNNLNDNLNKLYSEMECEQKVVNED